MDDHYVFVAGALSSDAGARQGFGRGTGPCARPHLYRLSARWRRRKRTREDGIEAVSIVTPNHVHFPAAKAFIEAGIHVICDKPLAHQSRRKRWRWQKLLAKNAGRDLRPHPQLFRLSDDPPGARHGGRGRTWRHPPGAGRISAGLAHRADIENSRPEAGGLAHRSQADGRRRLHWRYRHPRLSARLFRVGPEAATSLPPTSRPSSRAARSTTMSMCMLRFKGGARGMLWASQVAPGNENGLKLARLWHQGRARMDAGRSELSLVHALRRAEAAHHPRRCRLRCGGGARDARSARPSGRLSRRLRQYLHAKSARAIRASARAGKKADKEVQFPGIEDGVAGMAFIEACVKSSAKNGKWTKV